MTLGKAGGGREPEFFFQPNDVLVAPNGDIFVSEGHTSAAGSTARVLKFSKDGKLIKTWGKLGTGPGDFDQPHALAMDSRADCSSAIATTIGFRSSIRTASSSNSGNSSAGPAGSTSTRTTTSTSRIRSPNPFRDNHDGWKRGIRVGSAKDGSVKYFIPDPVEKATGTSAAEGVAADAQGNVYGAEVGPRALKRYVK